MVQPLEQGGPRILQCHGASYEADVFSLLKHSSFVVRAFEFGLADGALDCSNSYQDGESYASRFYDLHNRRHTDASELLLFDVKSSVGERAGDQRYITPVCQRQHVAFYIGMNSADTTFVDIIPNYYQVAAALREKTTAYTDDPSGKREVAVTISRQCRLPPSAYGGIDQCNAPYRVPLALVTEAVRRIQEHACGGDSYINPWTGVEHGDWEPHLTTDTRFIRPADSSDQATAYEAVLEIIRWSRHDATSRLQIDFVGHQPSLADLKILLDGKQYYVQHKIDSTVRSENSRLNRVTLARGDRSLRRHYFTAFDRFDFLWFHFTFSTGPPTIRTVIYFIPEKELPDEWYTQQDKETDFSRFPHLAQFRVVLDGDGAWLKLIERIVADTPSPRRIGERPLRNYRQEPEEDEPQPAELAGKTPSATHGRHVSAVAMRRGHRTFFYQLMSECARKRAGLLVVLATSHPLGDFGYCRYRWTPEESLAFFQHAKPPKCCHHLPSQTELVPISYYTQHAEAGFAGPNMSAATFRRLDASFEPRLMLWDVGGPDATTLPFRCAVIPTDDYKPTEAQRTLLAEGSSRGYNPSTSAMFKSGLVASEYGVGVGGPLCFETTEQSCWSSLWSLLNRFTDLENFEHPQGCLREPHRYRYTLQHIHQRFHEQTMYGEELPDEDE
ncbi:hypothetical protein MBLNU230_g4866t1 [Neophaeotheca triangularis]